MFLIRESLPEDLEQLLEVARHLDTVNLPHDRAVLARILEVSRASFAGERPTFEREYVFVLVDRTEASPGHDGRIIGTCMIQAQHGTRKAPHTYFDVLREERYSESLDRYFVHQCLRVGYNYDGPTEIGGLILLPTYRGRPEALGKILSYVRFLYIGLHRDRFRDEVLSELMPPLEPDGTSRLWETLGRHFTGLDYQEADRISKDNKEFIRALFPHGRIWTCLMPKETQEVIGVVGPATRGVEAMLKRIGFRYAHRIDPFDGGPHYVARTDDITLVEGTIRTTCARADDLDATAPVAIIGFEAETAPHFRAAGTRYRIEPDGAVAVPATVLEALGCRPGDPIGFVAV